MASVKMKGLRNSARRFAAELDRRVNNQYWPAEDRTNENSAAHQKIIEAVALLKQAEILFSLSNNWETSKEI